LPTELLERVADIFASLTDVSTTLARFLELTLSIADGGRGAVYLRDQVRGRYVRVRFDGTEPALDLPIAVVEGMFPEGKARLFDLSVPPLSELPAVKLALDNGVRGALGLPLIHGGVMEGVLGMGFPEPKPFDEALMRTLTSVARFPAAAIRQARTQELSDRRAKLSGALQRFGERALSEADEPALYRLILDTVVELTGADQASITELRHGKVRMVAGVGKDEALIGTEAPAELMSEALSREVPYVVPDVAAADGNQLLIKLARRFGAASFVTLAIRHQELVFGYVFAGHAQSHAFRAEELEALRILASMAAAALEQHATVALLHELARAKDRFLRIAAHELRTPITALHATTQLIEHAPQSLEDPERRKVLLERVHRQSKRLVRLVQQLVDTLQLGTGELPLQRVELDLGALCRDVADSTVPAGGPRVLVREDAPVVGHWDPVRLEQVITNLISNAARYSLPASEVTITVRKEGERALVSVEDCGIGIPAGQLEHVFTPFFRGSNAQVRYAGGLGLGLHITREIIVRHGGRISVESVEGAGTTFTVELPLRSAT
jgi:signal transduction histidine kinase